MPDLVVVPLPGMGTLAMTRTQFNVALIQGEEFATASRPSTAREEKDELVDAKTLERRTGVPASWWMAQARNERIPFLRIGRRVRFNPGEVLSTYVVNRRLPSE